MLLYYKHFENGQNIYRPEVQEFNIQTKGTTIQSEITYIKSTERKRCGRVAHQYHFSCSSVSLRFRRGNLCLIASLSTCYEKVKEPIF